MLVRAKSAGIKFGSYFIEGYGILIFQKSVNYQYPISRKTREFSFEFRVPRVLCQRSSDSFYLSDFHFQPNYCFSEQSIFSLSLNSEIKFLFSPEGCNTSKHLSADNRINCNK